MSSFCIIVRLRIPPKFLSPEISYNKGESGCPKQVHINFYTPKNDNFRICLPKRTPTFLAYLKFYNLLEIVESLTISFKQKQNYTENIINIL